jgi:Holliday junction resolvase
MNAAHKGRRREHQAREWLEGLGYAVTRSAGSKGAWDLVGLGWANVALAQVKSNEWPNPEERNKLVVFPAPEGTRRLMFRYDDRKQVRIRELVAGEWVDIA